MKNLNSKKTKDEKIELFVGILSIIFGLFAFCYGLFIMGPTCYRISDKIITKLLYDSISGELIEFNNCKHREGTKICDSTYQYMVNEVQYTIIYEQKTGDDYDNQTKTIYYNPKNPSKAKIYESTDKIVLDIIPLFIGVMVTLIGFVMAHLSIKILKKH